MDQDKALREQLIKMMRAGQAFRTRAELLEGLNTDEAGQKVADIPYTIWQLLEHMRFTQHDILDFCRNPDYKEPTWPDDYWPATHNAPSSEKELHNSLQTLEKELDEMINLVNDTTNNLFEPFDYGQGQNLMREAMLVAEHNAYHLGQLVLLRRLLGHTF